MMDFKGAMKKPWVKYGVIAVLVLGVAYIVYKRVAGASATTSTGTAVDPALAAMYQQQNQIAASQAAQQSAQQTQIALANIQAGAQTTQQANAITGSQNIATIQAQTQQQAIAAQTSQEANAVQGQIAMADINATNVHAQIAAQQEMTDAATQAQVTMGANQLNAMQQITYSNDLLSYYNNQTVANAQVAMAQTSANVQNNLTAAGVQIAAIQGQTQQTIANVQAGVAHSQISANQSTAQTGLIGGFVGNVLSSFL